MEYFIVVWSPFMNTNLGESKRFVTGDHGLKSSVIIIEVLSTLGHRDHLDGNPQNVGVKFNRSSCIKILHNEATAFLCQ